MRRLLLTALFVLSVTSTVALQTAAAEPRAAILCFHEVEEHPHTRFAMPKSEFLRQIDFLQKSGYSFVTMQQLADHLSGERPLPDKSVVLTFDDGWKCTYTEVFPELRKRGIPFTLFIYPKFVTGYGHSLSWREVREMSEAGVEIESHTMTHPFLSRRYHRNMTDDHYAEWLDRELSGSRRLIRKHTGVPVRFLAYPYGDYDSHVASAALRAGYTAAVTTKNAIITGESNPARLGRICLERDSSTAMLAEWLGVPARPSPKIALARAGARLENSHMTSLAIDRAPVDSAPGFTRIAGLRAAPSRQNGHGAPPIATTGVIIAAAQLARPTGALDVVTSEAKALSQITRASSSANRSRR